jgi:hypothetical protein
MNQPVTPPPVKLKPYSEMTYHPLSEQLVDVLRQRTQRNDALFFRLAVGYYFSLAAAQMRCFINTPDRGLIPVNMYALNLAPSGYGKTVSSKLMEKQVLHLFRQRFIDETFPQLAEDNLDKLANKRATRRGTDPEDEKKGLAKEFASCGSMLFSFDSGTAPAVKQIRHKLLLADAGSMNLIMDEVGTNLVPNKEVFDLFIELFDTGETKSKAIKNSAENQRHEEIVGMCPSNLLMFGAPHSLLDGDKTEQELMNMLATGYARRCFFGYVRNVDRLNLTAEEMYESRVNQANSGTLDLLAERLENLADMINANKRLVITRANCILLNEYQLQCEARAAQLPEVQDLRKRELAERHFKALKLAGAYAFIDDSPEVTEDHLYNAIKVAEDSGDCFHQILSRDKAHVRLAKYIAAVGTDVTQADLADDLPFYRGGTGAKQEMLTLATAWGYKNNVIIKKSYEDGIEFLRGETLKATDLSKMVLSYSTDIATDYLNDRAAFDQLHKLTQAQGMHWTAHHLIGGHRNEENCIPGFNLVVVDVDGGVPLSTARLLLKNYKSLIYTTKRHTDQENRFRIILPTNFELSLDAKDYKEFMSNIFEWLPFEVDTATGQRARKWMSHDGHYEYNDGELLDVLPFIPKTRKNEERKSLVNSQQSMDNLERWVINNIGDGNRNNLIPRYAMTLVDSGLGFDQIKDKVFGLNEKITDKLDPAELLSTVLVSVSKALRKR